MNLGTALGDAFDLRAALTEFSQVVVLDPRSAAAHYRKGRVLFDLRRLEEARPELEAAARLAPGDTSSLYLLALTEKHLHRPARSAELLRKVIELDAGDADAHFLLGQDLLLLSLGADAIPHFEKAAELNPQKGDALSQLTQLAEKYRPQEAAAFRRRFEAFLQQQHIDTRAGTLAAFAQLSAASRDWPEAVARFKEAIQACANCSIRGALHRDLGLVYCRTGDLHNGARELRLARNIDPGDAEVRKSLSLIEALDIPP